MKQVASLRYGVIFKKAFSDPTIFAAFVEDLIGTKLEISTVETEKSFKPPIGSVNVQFDLFAQDLKNRIVVDIQHERYSDHYDRFLHYQMVAILEQIAKSDNYRPLLTVYTIVVLTSGDKHKTDVAIIDFDPRDLKGEALGEIPHKVIYLSPKYVNEETPEPLREWLLAIDDSLDGEVDESRYKRPEVRRVFDIIEDTKVNANERKKMIEESHQEELKDNSYGKGLKDRGQEMLIRLLQTRFSPLPEQTLEIIKQTDDIAQLDNWFNQALTAQSLDELAF